MNEQLQEIYDNAQKAEACKEGLEWLTQFETIEEAEKDKEAPYYFAWYANDVIKTRFELGEKAISKNAGYAYGYAIIILKGRFKLGEKTISKYAGVSYYYAHDVIKGRFESGEEVISKNAYYSFLYAKYVLRGRFELGEEAILNSAYKERYGEFLDEISTFDQERVSLV